MARTFRRLLGLSTLFGMVACSFIVDTDEIDSGCASGTKYCDGRCVDMNDASYGCASEGCAPCETDDSGDPIGDRYIPKCERAECVIDRCVGDYGCDACDKHLLSNDQNCGTCMHACETGSTCSFGECVPSGGGADGTGGTAGRSAQPASTQQQKPTP